jgi:hypothetical protein
MDAYFQAFGNGPDYKAGGPEAAERFTAALAEPEALSAAIDRALAMSALEPKNDLDRAVEEVAPLLRTLWDALLASRDHHIAHPPQPVAEAEVAAPVVTAVPDIAPADITDTNIADTMVDAAAPETDDEEAATDNADAADTSVDETAVDSADATNTDVTDTTVNNADVAETDASEAGVEDAETADADVPGATNADEAATENTIAVADLAAPTPAAPADPVAAELHSQIFSAYQGLSATYDRFRDRLNQADAARRRSDLQAMADRGLVIRPAMLKLLDQAQALQDFLGGRGVTSEALTGLDLETFEPLYGGFLQSFQDYEQAVAVPEQLANEGLKPEVIEAFTTQAAQVRAAAGELMERRRNPAAPMGDSPPAEFADVLGALVDLYNSALNQ